MISSVPIPAVDQVDRFLDLALEEQRIEVGIGQRVRIMARLMSGNRVSGQELASALGVSRAAVHKHMQTMRGSGLLIDSLPGIGYILRPNYDLLLPEVVLPLLIGTDPSYCQEEPLLGLPYLYEPVVDSTNLVLVAAAQHDAPAGSLAITDFQSAGRGRLGRTWLSTPCKDLTFSVLLRPRLAPTRAHRLVLAASVATADLVSSLPSLRGRVGIKWPNDVLVDGGKVCGILSEASMDMDRIQWAVVGIGVNVNGDPSLLLPRREGIDRRPPPLSLEMATGVPLPRAVLLAHLLPLLAHRWQQAEDGQWEELLADYEAYDLLRGTLVEIRSGRHGQDLVVAGLAQGIGPEGELLVLDASGTLIPTMAGEVMRALPPDSHSPATVNLQDL